jgi:hypothetical protein
LVENRSGDIDGLAIKKAKLDSKHAILRENYQEGLGASNFDKLLEVLVSVIGGEAKQLGIIEKQIKTLLLKISNHPLTTENIFATIQQVHESCKVLSRISKTDHSVLQFLSGMDFFRTSFGKHIPSRKTMLLKF